jgi:Ca2+-transporting ATPase
MQRPPRDPKEMFFGTTKILKSLGKGLLLFVMVMAVYALSVHEQHTENEIRAISFSTLIIGNVFFIMSSLSNTRGIGSIFRKKNKAAILILFAALALLMLTLAIPGLQKIFAFSYPGWQHFGSAFIAAILLLMLLECFKWLGKKKIIRIVTNRKS